MLNTSHYPGTDTPEPTLLDDGDDDAVGHPLPDDGDLRTPALLEAPRPDVFSPDPARPL